MARKQSAGLLPFRIQGGRVEVLLVHPGGPFWAKKDDGAWSIAKGEYAEGEDPLEVARREFREETGFVASPDLLDLGQVKQPGGKLVRVWAERGDHDPATLTSNSFRLEWPPRSGTEREFPEVDRAAWFTLEEARRKLIRGQLPFLDRLASVLGRGPAGG
jgi:predicted NUDIX family NTP pyrophosphohydrolase